jgi:signal transduction histidine kinase
MRPKAIQRALMNLVSNALRYGDTAVLSVQLARPGAAVLGGG